MYLLEHPEQIVNFIKFEVDHIVEDYAKPKHGLSKSDVLNALRVEIDRRLNGEHST